MTIVGHARQCEGLLQDIERENTAHAYLFEGKKHLGKFTAAKWFASLLLTQNSNEEEEKRTLHLIQKNVHPDLLTLDQLWVEGDNTDWNIIAQSSNAPQAHRAKAKVKTNTIGIDDIRALQERLHETSQGARTCCIIRSIERLHITAANALLKILEEPPSHVTFCFTTESLSSIPSTIVSRMRTIRFSPVAHDELKPLLSEFAEEDRPFVLEIAQGSPGIIMRCQQDVSILRMYRQAHIDALSFLESSSKISRLQQMTEVLEKKQGESFFHHLFLHLQKKLRSDNLREAERAASVLQNLFPLLHMMQSNTHKSLLAARTSLQCSL